MLDYRLHRALLATEDRVQSLRRRRAPNPKGGRRLVRLPLLGRRSHR